MHFSTSQLQAEKKDIQSICGMAAQLKRWTCLVPQSSEVMCSPCAVLLEQRPGGHRSLPGHIDKHHMVCTLPHEMFA